MKLVLNLATICQPPRDVILRAGEASAKDPTFIQPPQRGARDHGVVHASSRIPPTALPTSTVVGFLTALRPVQDDSSVWLRTLSAQADRGCPFLGRMLGSGEVGSAYANPLKSNPSVPSRLAQWLQSASAEVWVKFLLALFGLGLAFTAALFSTVSRDAGNLWATIILSSTSLVLATLVGLVTVPYLARRVAVERMRESFDYDVTRAGIIYVVVTLVIGIAALNTGNNLLYIVVAAMLAAILVSGVVSAWVLRWLELDVRLPEHVFAGRPVSGHIVLHNPRRFLPSFSIRVVSTRKKKRKAVKQWQWEATTFAFPFNRPSEQQWLRLPDRRLRRVTVVPPPPGIFQGMAYFPFLPPLAELSADLELKFDQRGRYRESSFGLATRFPFAFLTKTRHVSLPREMLVYPRIEPTKEVFEILPLVQGHWESFVRGRGSDLYRIREYLPEDSARHVDWKATAKSGTLKVREFAREDERRMCIAFDNPEPGLMSEHAYEKAVDLTASLAWHFSTQQEAEVSFIIPGRSRTRDLHEFLAWLAVIEPGMVDPEPSLSEKAVAARDSLRAMNLDSSDDYNIVITARPRGSVPTDLWNCSYFVFSGDDAFDKRTERP
jgi:uncharacterized protein (DUF58 family)